MCKIQIKVWQLLHYANVIENDFIRNNLATLTEYGIPKSAITKLENHISSDLSEDLVLNEIRNKKLVDKINFIEYEKEKIKENL